MQVAKAEPNAVNQIIAEQAVKTGSSGRQANLSEDLEYQNTWSSYAPNAVRIRPHCIPQ